MPTPVKPQPITPTNPSTGRAGFSTSGGFPVSGEAVGALSGPWCVEEQTLNINYWRIPQVSMYSASASLVGFDMVHTFHNTRMAYSLFGCYKKYKDEANYATSAWEQSQLIEVLPVSADINGVGYGDLNASSMGPRGNAITTRPWKRRRLWDETSDVAVYEEAYGWNYSLISSGFGFTDTYLNVHNAEDWFGRLTEFATKPQHRGTSHHDAAKHVYDLVHPSYWIGGGYSTDTETKAQMISFIDGVGTKLAENFSDGQGGYYSNIPPENPGSPYVVTKTENVPSYKTDRHDWS
jgi:hypothetical protein